MREACKMYLKDVFLASLKRAKFPALFYILSSAIHVSTVANMHLVSLPISTASCVDVFNIPVFYTATLH